MNVPNSNIIKNNFSIFTVWESSDLVTQIIIFILFFSSICTWFLFISKFLKIRYIKRKMDNFRAKFNHEKHLQTIYNNIRKRDDDPLSIIFLYSMRELESSEIDLSKAEKLDNIKKSSQIPYKEILDDLYKNISILGTVASVSPFIGLLGTIIGIINSFQSIASSKSANISIVAPGIAEALFVTALGLFVAIPALIFFNYLMNMLETIENKSENFMEELYLVLSKIFYKS